MCAHGLAVARALSGAGIPVLALESRRSLPGLRTRCADVAWVPSLEGERLVEALDRLWRDRLSSTRPVLFLSNDRMVGAIADHWPQLQGQYRLPWGDADQRRMVGRLLDKDAMPSAFQAAGVDAPGTEVLSTAGEVDAVVERLGLPLIAKPVKPLSGFKAVRIDTRAALVDLVSVYSGSLPFVVQAWIPGGDACIHFAAFVLDRGMPVAEFAGRKIHSQPMGHTCIAEACPSPEVLDVGRRFFERFRISGAASLELKRAPDGRLLAIEPTVGRTDFWVDLAIRNGVNVPVAEYRLALGLPPLPAFPRDRMLWINHERDPFALGRTLLTSPRALIGRRPIFTYWRRDDPGPFASATADAVVSAARRVATYTSRRRRKTS